MEQGEAVGLVRIVTPEIPFRIILKRKDILSMTGGKMAPWNLFQL